jgi:hypothetical protein
LAERNVDRTRVRTGGDDLTGAEAVVLAARKFAIQ